MSSAVDVLVIDDNDLQLNYMQELLQSHGFITRTLQDGAQAVEEIRKCNPRLVILDIMMPGIDGFSVLKKIRDSQDIKIIPVIIYSSKAFAVDQKKALLLGANSFLVKPVKGSVIIDEVKKYV